VLNLMVLSADLRRGVNGHATRRPGIQSRLLGAREAEMILP